MDGQEILIPDGDYELAQEVANDFARMSKKYRSFYTTAFLNDENRKASLKFRYGKLVKLVIEKLDPEKD